MKSAEQVGVALRHARSSQVLVHELASALGAVIAGLERVSPAGEDSRLAEVAARFGRARRAAADALVETHVLIDAAVGTAHVKSPLSK